MTEQAKAARRALQIAKAKADTSPRRCWTSSRLGPPSIKNRMKTTEALKNTGRRYQGEGSNSFKAQRHEIDEHLGQADTKPTEGATEQTSTSSQEEAIGENHGEDDMSANNDVDMCASLRLDDLDEKTPPSLPIPRGILNATDGFTLDGLN
ncbi:uncharacterized protein PHALS_04351 [Plasmopara halstedii]|uniref:Uncharacterized protein n=1 Tax=Plasmopara halstedii TaxID=4781 RepID=A0A0P1B0S1_PLAHL|nr:uncharacterized protein PHALS_04351 [Plasmopara halstedii]CEG47480.1 hypothetical protein PHALS_04351 [Plasmopara halstedii]|eukprot:XP_024583849.1 hypothetical protein PHALS_04351 [Plasmopara halstedii]